MPYRTGDKVRLLRTKTGAPTRDTPVAEVADVRETKLGRFYKLQFLNGFMSDVPEEILVFAWSGEAPEKEE